MKTLPPTPNLDFLKRQAKDVLAALHEDDPAARLSDAQRAIAEQHGFRTWTELKAAVEAARATSAPFDNEVASAIAKAFDLGDPTRAVHLSDDVGGPVVRLTTGGGDWRAFSMLDGATEESEADSVRLMDAVRAVGVKVPQPQRTPDGSLLAEAGDRRWRVDAWIDLGPTIARPVSSPIAFKAGALLATMHSLRLEPSRGMHPWLSAAPRSADDWQRILAQVEELGAPWAGDLAGALAAIIDVSAGHSPAPADGLVLAHTDFQPPSTHLDQGDALVPTGWEFTGAIPPTWHLGMVLDSWTSTHTGEINERAARAIADGYASVAGELPALDVSMFSPVITAWLNWLVSRMNRALDTEGTAKDNAERELAHMLANPKDRARLERLLHAAGA